MRSYNIHEAKTQLSKLVELAEADQRRFDFMPVILVHDDFNTCHPKSLSFFLDEAANRHALAYLGRWFEQATTPPWRTGLWQIAGIRCFLVRRAFGRLLSSKISDVQTFRWTHAHYADNCLITATRSCQSLTGFPNVDHKDPFDRLLVSQAISEGVPLLTNDEQPPRYGACVLNTNDPLSIARWLR